MSRMILVLRSVCDCFSRERARWLARPQLSVFSIDVEFYAHIGLCRIISVNKRYDIRKKEYLILEIYLCIVYDLVHVFTSRNCK